MSGSIPDKPSQAEGDVGDDDLSAEESDAQGGSESDSESGTIGDSVDGS